MTDMIEQPAPPVDEARWEHAGGYQPEKGMTVPLLVGAVIQFILSAAVPRDPIEGGGAFMLGYALGGMIPVALVLYFAFGRKRDPAGAWKIPLMLAPVALLGVLIGGGGSGRSEEAAGKSIAAATERMIASEGRDAGQPGHSGATGNAGTIERLTLDMFRVMAEDKRNYEREIAASGFAEILAPAVIEHPTGYGEARRRLAAARAIVHRYRALHLSRIEEMADRIRGSDMSAGAKQQALDGFNRGVSGSLPRGERMWALELAVVDAFDGAIDVLERGHWQRQGDRFLFSREADLNAFNARMAQVETIVREQQDITRLQTAAMRADLDRLRGR
jgi:hypothetical protein